MTLLYVFVLSTAVSMDALASGAAYGLKGIHMPLASLGVVGLVTLLCTALAMGGTHLVGGYMDIEAATTTGASLLVALGIYRLLLDYLTRDASLHHNPGHQIAARKLTFSLGSLVIKIMVRPEAADIDESKHISSMEAVFLGLALGIDNMVAASAASLGAVLPVYTPLAMATTQVAFISIGVYGSEWLIGHRVRFRLLYVSGAVLVLLGLHRFL
ncbi:MAG: MntP/YtaF family protein [Sulfuricella sp.]